MKPGELERRDRYTGVRGAPPSDVGPRDTGATPPPSGMMEERKSPWGLPGGMWLRNCLHYPLTVRSGLLTTQCSQLQMRTVMAPVSVLLRDGLETTQAAPGVLPITTDDRPDNCVCQQPHAQPALEQIRALESRGMLNRTL